MRGAKLYAKCIPAAPAARSYKCLRAKVACEARFCSSSSKITTSTLKRESNVENRNLQKRKSSMQSTLLQLKPPAFLRSQTAHSYDSITRSIMHGVVRNVTRSITCNIMRSIMRNITRNITRSFTRSIDSQHHAQEKLIGEERLRSTMLSLLIRTCRSYA